MIIKTYAFSIPNDNIFFERVSVGYSIVNYNTSCWLRVSQAHVIMGAVNKKIHHKYNRNKRDKQKNAIILQYIHQDIIVIATSTKYSYYNHLIVWQWYMDQ